MSGDDEAAAKGVNADASGLMEPEAAVRVGFRRFARLLLKLSRGIDKVAPKVGKRARRTARDPGSPDAHVSGITGQDAAAKDEPSGFDKLPVEMLNKIAKELFAGGQTAREAGRDLASFAAVNWKTRAAVTEFPDLRHIDDVTPQIIREARDIWGEIMRGGIPEIPAEDSRRANSLPSTVNYMAVAGQLLEHQKIDQRIHFVSYVINMVNSTARMESIEELTNNFIHMEQGLRTALLDNAINTLTVGVDKYPRARTMLYARFEKGLDAAARVITAARAKGWFESHEASLAAKLDGRPDLQGRLERAQQEWNRPPTTPGPIEIDRLFPEHQAEQDRLTGLRLRAEKLAPLKDVILQRVAEKAPARGLGKRSRGREPIAR